MSDLWYHLAFGAHYPLLYEHRDETEAALCCELLPRLAPLFGAGDPADGRILDLGCGDGRHLALFASGVIPVVGLDLSAPLLESAQRRLSTGPGVPLVRGDMLSLPFGDEAFSSVLSLFTAFGYFGALVDNRSMLAQGARVLAPGGHWFLDYLNADRVREELGAGHSLPCVREAGPLSVTETKTLSEGADRVIKTVEVRPRPGRLVEAAEVGIWGEGLTYQEQVALFTIPEMDEMAKELGLIRVAEAGSYAGAPFGDGDRWILVYRRIGAGLAGEVPHDA